MRKIIILTIFLLSISLVSAIDLADYPEMFLVNVNDKIYFNAYIVIGDNAAASDVIGSVDIATSLNYDTGSLNPQHNAIEAILASELRGREFKHNIIAVGGPCINSVTAAIMGYPEHCADGFYRGKARIKLYENNGKIALIVAGFAGEDTRLAAKVLSNKLFPLKGDEVEVAGSSIKDIKLVSKK
tara:strand:- start:1112 stop:1666 length:555 start_codon:yes stop_codon:yes gene_type:complete